MYAMYLFLYRYIIQTSRSGDAFKYYEQTFIQFKTNLSQLKDIIIFKYILFQLIY